MYNVDRFFHVETVEVMWNLCGKSVERKKGAAIP